MKNIGLNVTGQGGGVKTENLLRDLDRLGSGLVLIRNEVGMANEVKAARPDIEVIFRPWPPGIGDDDLHTNMTAIDWFNYVQALGLHEDILIYCVNEPTIDYGGLQDWLLKALDLADTAGRRLVVGNFSVGNPGETIWLDKFEPLLRRLSGSNHSLGLHEYINKYLGSSMPHYVCRYGYPLSACNILGIDPPQILITEHGYDISGSWSALVDANTFAENMLMTHDFYAEDGIATCLFSYGNWSNGGDEFDVRPAMDALAAISWPEWIPNTSEQTEEEPDTEPEIKLKGAAWSFNVGAPNVPATGSVREMLDRHLLDNPEYIFFHNGHGEAVNAIKEARARGHNLKVCVRHDPLGQGDGTVDEIERRGGYKAITSDVMKALGDEAGNIWIEAGNEFEKTEKGRDYMLKWLDYAKQKGVKLSIGNFGYGTDIGIFYETDWWPIQFDYYGNPLDIQPYPTETYYHEVPRFDNNDKPVPGLWYSVIEAIQGTGSVLGLHLYWDRGQPDALFPFNPCRQVIHADVDQIWSYGIKYVGKAHAIEQLTRQHGMTLGQVFSNEWGRESLYQPWKGFQDFYSLDHYIQPEEYLRQCNWVVNNIDNPPTDSHFYIPDFKVQRALFAYASEEPDEHGGLFYGFNFAKYPEFMDLQHEQAQEIVMTHGTISPAGNYDVNIRSGASIEFDSVSVLKKGTSIEADQIGFQAMEDGDWHYYENIDGILSGWLRDDVHTFVEIPEEEPETEDPVDTNEFVTWETYTADGKVTDEWIGELQARIEALEKNQITESTVNAAVTVAMQQFLNGFKQFSKIMVNSWNTYAGFTIEEK